MSTTRVLVTTVGVMSLCAPPLLAEQARSTHEAFERRIEPLALAGVSESLQRIQEEVVPQRRAASDRMEGRLLAVRAHAKTLDAQAETAGAQAERQRARARAQAERAQERAREAGEREWGLSQEIQDVRRQFEFAVGDPEYNRAIHALDRGLYDEALSRLTKISAEIRDATVTAHFERPSPPRPDAVAYWLAYTQHRLGHAKEALATVSKLAETWPNSGWKNDARALEIEIRQSSDQPVRPEAIEDEELRLLAIQGLMRAERPEALPAVERIVFGVSPPRLKERAVFVLAQHPSPQVRDIMVKMLEGGANPDLQVTVVRHLAAIEPKNEDLLTKAYTRAVDARVKAAVISQLGATLNAKALVSLARKEQEADLKKRIVEQLTRMDAKEATDYLVEILNR